jgi:predicted hotdog family 3-hydroxylacyl-ACP dehydratase
MAACDYNILDLIPQRAPFVMIDRLVYSGEKSAKGSLFISESNILCHNNCFQESGLIEFIAQTAAAYTGYLTVTANKEVVKGFIAAVKDLVIYSLPSSGTEIQSEITVDNELLGYTIISGRIFQSTTLVAECELRILLAMPPVI